MQDDEDGVGSVVAPSARSREAEPRPRDGAGLRCPLDLDPLRFLARGAPCQRRASVRQLASCRSAEFWRVSL